MSNLQDDIHIAELEAEVERSHSAILALTGEVERLRAALEEIVSLGTIESIQQTRIAEAALRGEGEK